MSKAKENIVMKGQIRLPARASIWYLASGLLGKAFAVLTTPFFTRILSKQEYGQFTLYMTILGAASVVCSTFTSGSPIYKGLSHFHENKNGFTKACLTVSLGFSAIICILLLSFLPFFRLNERFLPFIVIQIFCDSIIGVFYSRKRFDYNYRQVCALSVISFVLPPISSLAVLSKFGGGYFVRIYSLTASSFICAIYAFIVIVNKPEGSSEGMIPYAIKQSIPLLPHSLSGAFTAQADKLIITALLGAGALAEYSLAHSLGISLAFLVSSVSGALNPWIIRRLEAGDYRQIGRVISLAFWILSSLAIFLTAISPEAIAILAPGDYSSARTVVLPIALSVLPNLLISTITVGLIFDGDGKYTAILSLCAAVFSLALNYMLIAIFGYLGAGISLLLSQLITTGIGFYFLHKSGLDQMLCTGDLIRCFLFSSVLGLAVFLLHSYPMLRILLLIPPAVIVVRCAFELKDVAYEKSLPA